MKRVTILASLLAFMIFTGTCTLPLHAYATDASEEVLWTEEYYRASDPSGDLSEAERNDLDTICIEFMKKYHADLTLLAIPGDRLEGYTLEEAAQSYYESSGFGYGEGHDGFQMVMNLDTNEVKIVAFGAAKDMVPESELQRFAESAAGFREKYGIYGPFYATTRHLNNYFEQHYGDATARVGEGSNLPAWYPLNPGVFPDYHDETAPRIVDAADLFTADEELQMETRLTQIREELQKDIVVYTDMSSYGFDQSILAADFFDFNGYGVGDDFEGVVLFICMDPDDRGWWTACSGPKTMELYTESVANQVDDLLYEHMVAGDYAEGVADWIENFRRIYLTGSPYLPDWAALDKATFERFHDADAPRVIDEIGLFTEQEAADLAAHAKEISNKYGQDVVILTAVNPGPIGGQEYSDRFYYFNGYGLGDEYEGILLTIFKRPGNKPFVYTSAFGKAAQKLTSTNRERLENRCEGVLGDRDYFDGVDQWLSQTDHMLRTGRAPQSRGHWIFAAVLSLIAGLIYGGISLARAVKRMETPSIATNANAYYVRNSLRVHRIADTFLRTSFSQTYSPPKSDDSGSRSSSSGGRSSYKSSYSGSSGRTHSGSGRKF